MPEPPIQSEPPLEEQDQLFGGDALQQRLDRRHLLVTPAPCGDGDLVGMHGKGERRRRAGMRHDAQHLGELRDFGAAAAEFARHAGLDEAGLLQQRVVFGDEAVALVELGRTRRQASVSDAAGPISTALLGCAFVSRIDGGC